ncbi:MAG: DUF1972 domain-containing protein [Lautropia sp.]|nr:DUF1972 domain-containing protein [Lautropia sp.]
MSNESLAASAAALPATTSGHALRILGIRGVPAAHGGFETFAEYLALYLAEKGWRITVYCQVDGTGAIKEDSWRGVRRIHIPVDREGPAGTIQFDWIATRHAQKAGEPCLTLGYNTAIFCTLLRLARLPNVINMDGIEWQRAKWGMGPKVWFYLNEWAGAWLGNHLVADHPEIKTHLSRRTSPDRITVIPYGAEDIRSADSAPVTALGLEPGRYLSVIARAEPENSLLEIVSGFSRKPRGLKLAVLGKYDAANPYHQAVKAAASDEVRFLGAIYDKAIVQALRFHSAAYVHGHQVGGTNPSLVEALGAGNAVIAHDNRFNRWVAGPGAAYFDGASGFADQLESILGDPGRLDAMRRASRARFEAEFQWDKILSAYETLLLKYQK